MNRDNLLPELRSLVGEGLPIPGGGHTPDRHLRLMQIGKRDLALARLAEAHFDAVAILAEMNRKPQCGAIFGVWASEIPGHGLRLTSSEGGHFVDGVKMFSSGATLIDKALVTIAQPEHRLIEIDLHKQSGTITIDESEWKTAAFRETRTATVTFERTPISEGDLIRSVGWYLQRPGFWHGAFGPACCWAGGAEGLVEFAEIQSRKDAHTLAHLAAMRSQVWAMRSFLSTAGEEIDSFPLDAPNAAMRALTVRHLVEQACSDVLRRFARAYGPYPMAMNEEMSLRYTELDLYLRQSHAERDLEALGKLFKTSTE